MKKVNIKKIIYSILVVCVFTIAFVFLIQKQKEVPLGDKIKDTFNYHTVYGKTLAVRDFGYDYNKYYVITFFSDGTFDIHMFNYYNSKTEYENDSKLLVNSIVDYNNKDLMLRTLYTKGTGTYDSVMENLNDIINSNNWRVYD